MVCQNCSLSNVKVEEKSGNQLALSTETRMSVSGRMVAGLSVLLLGENLLLMLDATQFVLVLAVVIKGRGERTLGALPGLPCHTEGSPGCEDGPSGSPGCSATGTVALV